MRRQNINLHDKKLILCRFLILLYLEVKISRLSLEQNSSFSCRQAFIHYHGLHQVWRRTEKLQIRFYEVLCTWSEPVPTSPTPSYRVLIMCIVPPRTYTSCSFSVLPQTWWSPWEVDESLSTTKTRVLIQRESTYFYFKKLIPLQSCYLLLLYTS